MLISNSTCRHDGTNAWALKYAKYCNLVYYKHDLFWSFQQVRGGEDACCTNERTFPPQSFIKWSSFKWAVVPLPPCPTCIDGFFSAWLCAISQLSVTSLLESVIETGGVTVLCLHSGIALCLEFCVFLRRAPGSCSGTGLLWPRGHRVQIWGLRSPCPDI